MLSEAGRQNFFKKSFEKPLTKPPRCDILIVSRGEHLQLQARRTVVNRLCPVKFGITIRGYAT